MSRIKLKIHKNLHTLPIFNWQNMRKDLRYLYKLPHYEKIHKLPQSKRLAKAAEGLILEYHNHFGTSDELFNKTDTELRILELEIQIAHGDMFAKTLLAVEMKQMSFASNSGETKSEYKVFTESVAILEEWLSFKIDIYTYLTIPYYEHFESYKRKADRAAANARG